MKLEQGAFIGLLVLVTLAFFGLLADFFQPVFWAATLAVLFLPVHRRFQALLKQHRSTAAFLTLLVIILTVLIPAWAILSAVVNEAASFYARLQSGEINPAGALDWLRGSIPLVNDLLDRVGLTRQEIQGNLSSAAITVSQFIATQAVAIGQNAVRFGAMFFLMVYVLFFFIRDGDHLVECIICALPLGDERERELFAKFAEVSRATVKGTLIIGLVQGFLGGTMFWVLGVEGAVFWGTVMVIMSLLPVVGASLVWAPAALILAANGEMMSALILVAFGVLVIGLIDNLLRPVLVGRDTRMPDYLVLLSTLGGLTLFGVSGFVIGPVIAALFLAVWVMFAKEFNGCEILPHELKSDD
jgi:predicted PurR-regulated permease PerM